MVYRAALALRILPRLTWTCRLPLSVRLPLSYLEMASADGDDAWANNHEGQRQQSSILESSPAEEAAAAEAADGDGVSPGAPPPLLRLLRSLVLPLGLLPLLLLPLLGLERAEGGVGPVGLRARGCDDEDGLSSTVALSLGAPRAVRLRRSL